MIGGTGLAALLGGLGMMLTTTGAGAAEIAVIGSTAMREALEATVPLFERTSGATVALRFESGSVLPGAVKDGAPCDLVMTTPATIEELTKAGRLVPNSRVDFVRSGVGVAVRAGAPKPDIATEPAFKAALLKATSVGISQGPSGVYTMQMLDKLGIAAQIAPKAVRPDLGVRVGTLVADGKAEIGLQQITELLPIPGIAYVGPLPASLQTVIVYGSARSTAAKNPDGAAALVAFLSSEAVAPILTRMGLEPVRN